MRVEAAIETEVLRLLNQKRAIVKTIIATSEGNSNRFHDVKANDPGDNKRLKRNQCVTAIDPGI